MKSNEVPTVLLADDNPAHLTAIGNALRDRGLKVIAVNTGDAARLAASREPEAAAIDLDFYGDAEVGLMVIRDLKKQDPSLFVQAFTSVKYTNEHITQFGADGVARKQFGRDRKLANANEIALEIAYGLSRHRARLRNKVLAFFGLLVMLPMLAGTLGSMAACLGRAHYPPVNDWAVRSLPLFVASLFVLTVSMWVGRRDREIRDNPAFEYLVNTRLFMVLGTLLPGILYDMLKYLLGIKL